MEFALIKDGKVVNVIVADQAFADSIAHEWDAVVASTGAGIGWTYDGTTFHPPVVEAAQ